jgi:hypothetical protein
MFEWYGHTNNAMNYDEKYAQANDAGDTTSLQGNDSPTDHVATTDDKNTDAIDNSANGSDSTEVRGGQQGRNLRGIGSTDMDSQNGVLRLGDQDESTMAVTPEGAASAVASTVKTSTSTVSVTTAGPDDYASDPVVNVPNAQEEAKKQPTEAESNDVTDSGTSETKESEDVAETGTSIDHQPTY